MDSFWAGMEDSGYRDYEISFVPGDMLFVYTDGVPEATNAQKELYRTEPDGGGTEPACFGRV